MLGAAPAGARLPAAPRGWPTALELGLTDGPGGAAALRRRAAFGFRYQYLAGGVTSGEGWSTWNPNGTFVSRYVSESVAARTTPVFSYYMLLQSGRQGRDEARQDLENLRDPDVMRALYRDLELFFARAGAFRTRPVVLQVEPDLWGYVEQAARGDDAATVPAAVASTGLGELAGLPNDASGFARAVVRLRNRAAPNVRLGYHISVWGTKIDIAVSDPRAAEVDRLARRSARFYRSLNAPFDVAFAEFDDRDSGFSQRIQGQGPEAWWNAGDFARHVRFLAAWVAAAGRRVVLWQIPLGNTRLNDTWTRFRDNRVQWLLGEPRRSHLRAYARAGVLALLFGGGADGTTRATTDGGYFFGRAAAYYRGGRIPLAR